MLYPWWAKHIFKKNFAGNEIMYSLVSYGTAICCQSIFSFFFLYKKKSEKFQDLTNDDTNI